MQQASVLQFSISLWRKQEKYKEIDLWITHSTCPLTSHSIYFFKTGYFIYFILF